MALLTSAIYTPATEASDPVTAKLYGERLLALRADVVRRSGGAIRIATSIREVREAVTSPSPAGPSVLLSMEGVAPLGGDAAALDWWYAQGLRVVGLTHNPRNAAGDGTGVPVAERRRGLTPFGRELMVRMGELGVLPDIAHLAEEACGDVFDGARGPVVCTHAGVRAVNDHWRNLSDAQVRSVAASGGVVGIDFYPPHIGRDGVAALADVVAHMEHVASLVGVEHVALGADFGGFDEPGTTGLEDASCYPALAAALRERGWTAEHVAAAFHGNALRVLEAVLA
jgi:membrane dipeptidase